MDSTHSGLPAQERATEAAAALRVEREAAACTASERDSVWRAELDARSVELEHARREAAAARGALQEAERRAAEADAAEAAAATALAEAADERAACVALRRVRRPGRVRDMIGLRRAY